MKVTFDGVAATKFTLESDTQVTVDVPLGAKTGNDHDRGRDCHPCDEL
jgi:hypothetical protein